MLNIYLAPSTDLVTALCRVRFSYCSVSYTFLMPESDIRILAYVLVSGSQSTTSMDLQGWHENIVL